MPRRVHKEMSLWNYTLLSIIIVLAPLGNMMFSIGTVHSVISGYIAYAAAVVIYSIALRNVPVHMAQCVLSLQYFLTYLGAVFILHEDVTPTKWIGFALIISGVFVVGWAER
jgi:drug/metabolite transporter (DMT)-like permease